MSISWSVRTVRKRVVFEAVSRSPHLSGASGEGGSSIFAFSLIVSACSLLPHRPQFFPLGAKEKFWGKGGRGPEKNASSSLTELIFPWERTV